MCESSRPASFSNEHHADADSVVDLFDDLLGSRQHRGADLSVVGDVEHESDRLALGRTREGRTQQRCRQSRTSRQDSLVVRDLVSLPSPEAGNGGENLKAL